MPNPQNDDESKYLFKGINTPEAYASGVESFSCFASGLIGYDLQWNFMSHGESLQVALQN